MPNRDLILLETVKTHRARLTAAFVYGELADRRVANDNVRRTIGGIVLAAVICAGCVGFSLVSSLLGNQAAAQRAQLGMGPATGPIFVADTFDRSTTVGWGRAERGGAWRLRGNAAAYTVTAGTARMQVALGQRRGGYLPDQLQDRSDLTVTVQRTESPRAGDITVEVLGRRVSATQDYHASLRLGADGSVAITLVRRSEPTNPNEPAQQVLSPTVILIGPTQDPEEATVPIAVRIQTLGTGDTTLRAKAWIGTGNEPDAWTVTGSDGTAGLQRPGTVGLTATMAGSEPDTGPPVALDVLDVVGRIAP